MSGTHLFGCTKASFTDCWCEPQRYLYIALISVLTLYVQVDGGIESHSLGLFADSVHVLLDGVNNLLTLIVVLLVRNPHQGHHIEEVGMRVSAQLLLLALGIITLIAFFRIMQPQEVDGAIMLKAGSIGLALNIVQLLILKGGVKRGMSRAQLLHITADIGSSVAVCIGAVCLWLFHVANADAYASLMCVAIVSWHAVPMALGKGHKH